MYSSVLSALFLGMVPISGLGVDAQLATLNGFHVAPPAAPVAITQHLSASGVVIMDVQSGQEVYGYGATTQRPMASITKLMTALLIAENHDMDEWVRIPASAPSIEGNKAYLQAGTNYRVGDLLSALLIGSANDAAQTLAVFHSGSVPAFAEAMNKRAKELGLKDTSYTNPSGLDSAQQYSTPKDIAWLAMFAMRNPEIRQRMGTRADRIVSREGNVVQLSHTHALLHSDSPVLAGKTGTTNGAGECLVSLIQEGNREYMVVLLHSQQRYGDMRKILDSFSPTVVSAHEGV